MRRAFSRHRTSNPFAKTIPYQYRVDRVPIPRARHAEYPLALRHEKTGHQIPEPSEE